MLLVSLLHICTKFQVFIIGLAGFRPSEKAKLSMGSPKDPNCGKFNPLSINVPLLYPMMFSGVIEVEHWLKMG